MGESWFLLSVQFADHGGTLTSAIRPQHHVDPPTPSVTWQSREHRETRWTHGFASPPYDGFAGSGMKNPVKHRTTASERDRSERCEHLQFYTANLGHDFRAVKSDRDFLSYDSCFGMSNADFSLRGCEKMGLVPLVAQASRLMALTFSENEGLTSLLGPSNKDLGRFGRESQCH